MSERELEREEDRLWKNMIERKKAIGDQENTYVEREEIKKYLFKTNHFEHFWGIQNQGVSFIHI